MKIDIRGNVKEITKGMSRIAKKQVPYAVSKTINEVAKLCQRELQKQIKIHIKNPTAFTKKSTFISYSNKNQSPIRAIVGIKDKQAEFLIYVEEGGISVATGKSKPVPVAAFKNKFGNIPYKKIGKLLGNKDKYFSGTPAGGNRPAGLYQRSNTKKGGNKLKLLASWQKSTKHVKHTRFAERVALIVARNFDKVLRKQMALAIGSMR